MGGTYCSAPMQQADSARSWMLIVSKQASSFGLVREWMKSDASQGAAFERASKIFDNRIDWVVVTTRLSNALAQAKGLAKLSVFRY